MVVMLYSNYKYSFKDALGLDIVSSRSSYHPSHLLSDQVRLGQRLLQSLGVVRLVPDLGRLEVDEYVVEVLALKGLGSAVYDLQTLVEQHFACQARFSDYS